MIESKSVPSRLFDTVIYIGLIGLMIVTVYPLLHVLMASVSDSGVLVSHKGVLLWPIGFNLDAYANVFSNGGILTGYRNTLFILVVGVLFHMFFTLIGAYVLSRRGLMWNKPIMMLIVFTMFFNGGLIPFFLVVKGAHLIDSLFSLIVPFMINTFYLIIMRTAFQGLPDSLEESAKIDGAGHFVILFRIAVPLCLPVIAVLALYYGVDKWNGWFYSSVFLQNRELFPLQLILREILIANSTDGMASGAASGDQAQLGESIKYATIMTATIPILCVYPFLQKYFVKGTLVGAVKG